jgi:hypothetical protein
MRHGRGIGARRRGGSSQVEADDLLVGHHSGRARLYWSDCRHGKVLRGAVRVTCAGEGVRDERWRVLYHLCNTSRAGYQLNSVRMSRRGEDCLVIQAVKQHATWRWCC